MKKFRELLEVSNYEQVARDLANGGSLSSKKDKDEEVARFIANNKKKYAIATGPDYKYKGIMFKLFIANSWADGVTKDGEHNHFFNLAWGKDDIAYVENREVKGDTVISAKITDIPDATLDILKSAIFSGRKK